MLDVAQALLGERGGDLDQLDLDQLADGGAAVAATSTRRARCRHHELALEPHGVTSSAAVVGAS